MRRSHLWRVIAWTGMLLVFLALPTLPVAARGRRAPQRRLVPVRLSALRQEARVRTLIEVDRLIGDAARHIGARQTRDAMRTVEDESTRRLLRRLALAVAAFVDAEQGRLPAAQALQAAHVLHKAALAYDAADGRR